MKQTTLTKLKLTASMLIFGTIRVVRRYLPCSSGVLALTRGALGSLFLLAVHFAGKKAFPREALRKNLALLCVSGALIGANWICLFEAYRYTSVAVATVCYYMAPVLVILLSPLLLREKLTARKLVCALAAVCGVALISGVSGDGAGIKGVLFGLAAAAMYAFVVILNKFITGLCAADRTLIQLAAATVALLPYVLLTGGFSSLELTPSSVALLLVAGVLHTGVAYALYFGSLGGLPAQTAALLSYIDPVTAVLLSAAVLKEPLAPLAAFGAALTLLAALIGDAEPQRRKAQD